MLMDNLSTGSMENIRHLKRYDRMQYFLEAIENRQLLAELVDEADVVFHLAAAVGVRLIVESPVRTIETNVNGTHLVLEAACKKRKTVLLASTSEVYGKTPTCLSSKMPTWFWDRRPRAAGVTRRPRPSTNSWACPTGRKSGCRSSSPACSIPWDRARPGATEWCLPNFVKQALRNEPMTVFGNGKQSRCFCDVQDTVEALVRLMNTERAVGQVINIGNTEEISIEDLARAVKKATDSSSPIVYVPYEQAYEPGFEDMMRRLPAVEKLQALTGFRPQIPLPEIINRVVAYYRQKAELMQAPAGVF